MTDPGDLEPQPGVHVTDPGARHLSESSDEEDQFSDAQSGLATPYAASPVPATRIEKTDNEPLRDKAPHAEAHEKREQDTEPDEVAAADADGPKTSDERSESAVTRVAEEAPGHASSICLDKVDDQRSDNAEPEKVAGLDEEDKAAGLDEEDNVDGLGNKVGDLNGNDTVTGLGDSVSGLDEKDKINGLGDKVTSPNGKGKVDGLGDEDDLNDKDNVTGPEDEVTDLNEKDKVGGLDEEAPKGNDDFGDDFDDFEEGGGQDDGFDDFDENDFQQAPAATASTPLPAQPTVLPFPIPDLDGLSSEEVISATEPYLDTLFPPQELEFARPPPLSKEAPMFLTPRSASLWSQLVAPPPLSPPDWIRSRTRRLFLVSLGVPVDLDEILPASKQKKLVLPSSSTYAASPRTSSDSRPASRLRRGEGNASSASVDSHGRPREHRWQRGPPPQPELDLVAARYLCMTTNEALDGMTDEELEAHVAKLESIQGAAKDALDYWQKRTDEKIGDREAFEGVIENLVKHARKVRK